MSAPFTLAFLVAILVNIGSASDACQKVNRQPGSLACIHVRELPIRADIWRFEANALSFASAANQSGFRGHQLWAGSPAKVALLLLAASRGGSHALRCETYIKSA